MQVYDIAANPALPTLLAQVADPLAASGVALDDGRAFVTEGIGGLWIVDVSRAQPQVLGHRELPGYAAGGCRRRRPRLRRRGNRRGARGGHLGPPAPDLVTTVDTPGMAMDVAVEGDVAVVAEGSRGVRVFDLGEPLRPRDVAFVAVRGDVWDATLADGLAFVTANAGGLRVIDVADPAQPRTAGRLVQPYPYRSVALGAPGYAYLAGTGPGMSVVRYTVGVSPTGTSEPAGADGDGDAALRRHADIHGLGHTGGQRDRGPVGTTDTAAADRDPDGRPGDAAHLSPAVAVPMTRPGGIRSAPACSPRTRRQAGSAGVLGAPFDAAFRGRIRRRCGAGRPVPTGVLT